MRPRFTSDDDLACYGDHLRDEAKDTAHTAEIRAYHDQLDARDEACELERNLPIARKVIVDKYRDAHGVAPGTEVDVEAQARALARSWVL